MGYTIPPLHLHTKRLLLAQPRQNGLTVATTLTPLITSSCDKRLPGLPTRLESGVHRRADVAGGVLQLGLGQRRAARGGPVHRLPPSEYVPLREHLAEHLLHC